MEGPFPDHEVINVGCEWHSLAPGDGTAYEFLISDGVKQWPARTDESTLFIASVQHGAGRPMFGGYVYNNASIIEVAERYRELLWAPKGEYERGISAGIHDPLSAYNDPFVGYMAEHSKANTWTALAAIRCAAEFLGVKGETDAAARQ